MDGNCEWAQGASYNVTAQCLYLGAFIVAGCCLGAAEKRRKEDDDGEEDEPLPAAVSPTARASPSKSKQPRVSKVDGDQGKEKRGEKSSKKWIFKRSKKSHQKENDDDDDDDAAVHERLEAGGTTASSVTSGYPTESSATISTERPPWFASYY
jgi:hypothetical protein